MEEQGGKAKEACADPCLAETLPGWSPFDDLRCAYATLAYSIDKDKRLWEERTQGTALGRGLFEGHARKIFNELSRVCTLAAFQVRTLERDYYAKACEVSRKKWAREDDVGEPDAGPRKLRLRSGDRFVGRQDTEEEGPGSRKGEEGEDQG